MTGNIQAILQDLCDVMKKLNDDTKNELIRRTVSKKLKDVELQINYLE